MRRAGVGAQERKTEGTWEAEQRREAEQVVGAWLCGLQKAMNGIPTRWVRTGGRDAETALASMDEYAARCRERLSELENGGTGQRP